MVAFWRQQFEVRCGGVLSESGQIVAKNDEPAAKMRKGRAGDAMVLGRDRLQSSV
jgi:hypothetical protein